MLTEPQERWLQALESGDYQQGKKYLHKVLEDGNYFCCLGVACNLFKDELELNIERKSDIVGYNDAVTTLPLVVQVHLKLRNELGRPIVGAQLSCLNDSSGKTFKEIATIIRENPSNFFMEIDNHVN